MNTKHIVPLIVLLALSGGAGCADTEESDQDESAWWGKEKKEKPYAFYVDGKTYNTHSLTLAYEATTGSAKSCAPLLLETANAKKGDYNRSFFEMPRTPKQAKSGCAYEVVKATFGVVTNAFGGATIVLNWGVKGAIDFTDFAIKTKPAKDGVSRQGNIVLPKGQAKVELDFSSPLVKYFDSIGFGYIQLLVTDTPNIPVYPD